MKIFYFASLKENLKTSYDDMNFQKPVTISSIKKILIEKKRKRKLSSEVFSLRGNYNKLNKATGWKPSTNFITGLKKTIIWIKKNQTIYKDIYNI